MTETKWTPGPWKQCKNGECTCGIVWSIPGDFPVCAIGGGSIFKCHAQFPVAVAHTHMADAPDLIYASLPAEQAVANANLMAAAPDLYAALDFVKFIEEKGYDEKNAYVDLEDDDECICLTFRQFREIMLARRKARGE
jgi:hypothetical protein